MNCSVYSSYVDMCTLDLDGSHSLSQCTPRISWFIINMWFLLMFSFGYMEAPASVWRSTINAKYRFIWAASVDCFLWWLICWLNCNCSVCRMSNNYTKPIMTSSNCFTLKQKQKAAWTWEMFGIFALNNSWLVFSLMSFWFIYSSTNRSVLVEMQQSHSVLLTTLNT